MFAIDDFAADDAEADDFAFFCAVHVLHTVKDKVAERIDYKRAAVPDAWLKHMRMRPENGGSTGGAKAFVKAFLVLIRLKMIFFAAMHIYNYAVTGGFFSFYRLNKFVALPENTGFRFCGGCLLFAVKARIFDRVRTA